MCTVSVFGVFSGERLVNDLVLPVVKCDGRTVDGHDSCTNK
jgi:hypothetical protein